MSILIGDLKIADIGRYINLDRRVDRNKKILDELDSKKITGIKRKSAHTGMHCGRSSIIATTFQLYQEFLKTGKDTMIVLEDDCKFIDRLYIERNKIFTDIYNSSWDLFWLGCHHRRPIRSRGNNCFQVSSPVYCQSYIIKRDLALSFVKDYNECNERDVSILDTSNAGLDELLCLYVNGGKDLVTNALSNGYYKLEQPLDIYKPKFIALCYKEPLSTQYNSRSDTTDTDTNLEDWLLTPYPIETSNI
jgi:hypothetical protein